MNHSTFKEGLQAIGIFIGLWFFLITFGFVQLYLTAQDNYNNRSRITWPLPQ